MEQPDRLYVAQIGGDHYGNKYGHWDYCMDARIEYLPGCATKYIYRWQKKNGIVDLEKALSYIDKMITGVNGPRSHNVFIHDHLMSRWFNENNVGAMERLLCYEILNWRDMVDLKTVRNHLSEYIFNMKELLETRQRVQQDSEATPAYVNQG